MKTTIVWDTDLNHTQKQQFAEIERLKRKDPFLTGMDVKWSWPLLILDDRRNVIGGFDAARLKSNGRYFSRAANPYMLPQYRKQGIMKKALEEYFATRRPALAAIDDRNEASIALYTSLGFVKWKPADFGDGHKWHLYRLN